MCRKDFLLSILKNSPVFSAITMVLVATSWAAPEKSNSAWRSPNWGFKKGATLVKAHPLSSSLIFDQKFDKVSYRPAPRVYVSEPLIPSEIPENISKEKVAKKEIENVFSPFFVERSLPVTRIAEAPAQKQKMADIVTGQAIENVIASRKQEKLIPEVPAKVLAQATPNSSQSKTTQTIQTHHSKTPFVAPAPDKNTARIVVIDEESLLNRDPQVVAGAKISWTGYRSGLITETDKSGLARPPYPNIHSMRFVVEAEGYLPALGYAVKGVVTPVVLVPEKRLAPILQSLGIVPEAGKTLVLGKVLDKKMRPLSGVTIDASLQKSGRVFYSAGSFGVFHPGIKETGPQGDFLITGLRQGLQYIMPTQSSNPAGLLSATQKDLAEEVENKEWPSLIADFSALPQVISVAVQEGTRADLKSQIVDSFSMQKPSSGVHLTIGGQRGLFIPDEEGFVRLKEIFHRPSVDVIEVHSPGYLKSWATPIASAEAFPDPVLLYSREQLISTFQAVSDEVNFSQGLVLANLRAEKFGRPVRAEVFSFNGKKNKRAKVFYFDEKTGLNPQLNATVPVVGSLAVANLEDGEWHILLLDAATGLPVSGQVVRVQKNTVSQIQF